MRVDLCACVQWLLIAILPPVIKALNRVSSWMPECLKAFCPARLMWTICLSRKVASIMQPVRERARALDQTRTHGQQRPLDALDWLTSVQCGHRTLNETDKLPLVSSDGTRISAVWLWDREERHQKAFRQTGEGGSCRELEVEWRREMETAEW